MERHPVYTQGVHRPLPVRRFVVKDTSMQPALRPGDRVLVYQWARPRSGDVIVVRDPEWRLGFSVKRIASVEANGDLVLRGDNINVSRDSRHFGPVSRQLVVGKVIYRYGPAERRGLLPAPE